MSVAPAALAERPRAQPGPSPFPSAPPSEEVRQYRSPLTPECLSLCVPFCLLPSSCRFVHKEWTSSQGRSPKTRRIHSPPAQVAMRRATLLPSPTRLSLRVRNRRAKLPPPQSASIGHHERCSRNRHTGDTPSWSLGAGGLKSVNATASQSQERPLLTSCWGGPVIQIWLVNSAL